MASKTDTIHIRVEHETKEAVEKVLRTLGMTSTEAINIFLKQIILTSSIPFKIKVPKCSDEMLEALKEADEIMENSEVYSSYKSAKEFMKAIDND